MRKAYSSITVIGFTFLLSGAIGCHQEPDIPASIIPTTCQINSIANVNEAVHDTTYYKYNAFGSIEEITYRQWVSGRLAVSNRQTFFYNSDHYLNTSYELYITYSSSGNWVQQNRTHTYTYQEGQVDQVTTSNAQSGQIIGFKIYTYDQGKVKTYTETDGQKSIIRSYSFDGLGKLSQAKEAGSEIELTNGKITKRTLQDSTIIDSQFDSRGQLVSEITVAANGQTERTFTYDNRPHWNKTLLLFRGIPVLDLGGHTDVHNIATSNLRQTTNGRTMRDQSFAYQYQFNKANYSTGYSRSDGFRQRINYSNCL
ncbi:hypothetical protein GCM10028807_23530 [Spirosoma daeguense]